MGHKVHPYGFRIGIIKPWLAKWYADRDYATLLQEDMRIRELVAKQLSNASVSQVEIERGPPDRRAQLLDRDLLTVEVPGHHDVVDVREALDQLIAGELDVVDQRRGHRFAPHDAALALVVPVERLALQQVDDARKRVRRADRQLQRQRPGSQPVALRMAMVKDKSHTDRQ